MTNTDIVMALIGGALIGLSASGMLIANGRVMGVSGIIGGLFNKNKHEVSWRILFLLGLFIGSLLIPTMGYGLMAEPFNRNLLAAVFGGLLVGFGTTVGNGCTSGHGVCGVSRLSPRSIVATVTFILFGVLTEGLMNLIEG